METFVNYFKIIIIGIVEGISEWLPISSTGHMIIFGDFLNIESTLSTEVWNLLLVVIQLGAILAVLVSFIKKIWPFGKSKTKQEKKQIWLLLLNILIACLPAAVIGLIFEDLIDQYLMSTIVVAITLILYGIFFIVIEYCFKRGKTNFKIDDVYNLTWKNVLIIGFAQVLAMIPGTSRSGITILSAMLIGCNRHVAAEFSFLVAIPIMFGASGLKTVKFFMDGNKLSSLEISYILVGCVVAFVVSMLTIKFFLKFLNRSSFTIFGWYRVFLGIILIEYYLINNLTNNPNYAYEVSKYTYIVSKNIKPSNLVLQILK